MAKATAKQQNTLDIINGVRGTLSDEFQRKVPEATFEYFGDFTNPLFKYTAMMNEFINGLVNKVGITFIQSKMANNPLALLKKGDKPMGSDVEELFVEMAQAKEFNRDGDNLLARNDAKVRVLYHRLNYKASYDVTWSRTELKRGFTDIDSVTKLITDFINSLYSGAYHDEFLNTKRLIGEGLENNLFVTAEVVEPTDNQTAKNFAKAVKKDSLKMKFTGKNYNLSRKPDGTLDPVSTYTEQTSQVLIINSDALVEVDVELLASVFNESKADFRQIEYIIPVDDFETDGKTGKVGSDVIAILADRGTFQIYDDQFYMEDVFYNPSNQTSKAYLHVDQTLSISTFGNAIVYKKKVESTEE